MMRVLPGLGPRPRKRVEGRTFELSFPLPGRATSGLKSKNTQGQKQQRKSSTDGRPAKKLLRRPESPSCGPSLLQPKPKPKPKPEPITGGSTTRIETRHRSGRNYIAASPRQGGTRPRPRPLGYARTARTPRYRTGPGAKPAPRNTGNPDGRPRTGPFSRGTKPRARPRSSGNNPAPGRGLIVPA